MLNFCILDIDGRPMWIKWGLIVSTYLLNDQFWNLNEIFMPQAATRRRLVSSKKNFARNEKTSQQDFIFIADEFLDVKASNFKNK